jgi:hypothetical protein
MSHEADVALGEGHDYGASNFKSEKVRGAKTHSNGIAESRAHQERRENGHADPCGDCE